MYLFLCEQRVGLAWLGMADSQWRNMVAPDVKIQGIGPAMIVEAQLAGAAETLCVARR